MKHTVKYSLLLLLVAIHAQFAVGAPQVLGSEEELLTTTHKYKGVFLFLGHGSKSQYGNTQATLQEVDAIVQNLNATYGPGNWLAVFGGDSFNADKPDIALVMKHLKTVHHVPIMAIQSDVVIPWGGVDQHIDYVRYVPTHRVPALDAAGRPIIEQGKPKMNVHWGGLIDGQPRGPSAVYLGQEFIGGSKPVLTGVYALGGGPIALQEAHYAHDKGIPVTYVRLQTRFPEVNGPYGSLDQWALSTGSADSTNANCIRLMRLVGGGQIPIPPRLHQ